MVTIDSVTVNSYDFASLTVSWEFYETWESLDPYTVSVYRSTNPAYVPADYVCLASGIPASGVASYEDTSVSGYLSYRWQDFYYTVIPYVEATGVSGIAGTPARLELPIDLVAKDIVRRTALALKTIYGGKTAYVLKRKKSGTRCSVCWDDVLQRRTVEGCRTCFDTGWVGGFWSQYPVLAAIGPGNRRTMLNVFGEWEPQDSFLRCGPNPTLSPQDVVVDLQNRRWRVVEMRPVEKGLHIIQQQARLMRINETDIMMEFPITW